jgi:hypothetical protein
MAGRFRPRCDQAHHRSPNRHPAAFVVGFRTGVLNASTGVGRWCLGRDGADATRTPHRHRPRAAAAPGPRGRLRGAPRLARLRAGAGVPRPHPVHAQPRSGPAADGQHRALLGPWPAASARRHRRADRLPDLPRAPTRVLLRRLSHDGRAARVGGPHRADGAGPRRRRRPRASGPAAPGRAITAPRCADAPTRRPPAGYAHRTRR